jgi:hypothetical protein
MKNDKFLVQDSLKAGILNGLKLEKRKQKTEIYKYE